MMLGSYMEHPSGSGRVGTGIRDCTSRGQGSHGALALELASLAGLAGDGDTGDTIGTTGSCLTITATYPRAESSLIAATSIAPADFMGRADFMAEEREDSHPMPRLARIPARSAASIMEEWQEASHLAGSRASVEALLVAASTEAEGTAAEDAGDSVRLPTPNGS